MKLPYCNCHGTECDDYETEEGEVTDWLCPVTGEYCQVIWKEAQK